ncbi:hypothetical protein [Kineosporia sp. A_224]|uniref:hypothetical protein n=1 Tax=Kineosporia sp. A_224 TaxID=1962180 RepID=UPI000B4C16D5|nr:hypothetical protein [Kineosporia sp. A_224]
MTAGPDAPRADPAPWRFRRLLALYPAQWQADHGDAMLGVMLDAAEADGRAGPTAREALSALGHATTQWRSRWQGRQRHDAVLRSFAALGPAAVVSGAVLAALSLGFGELGPILTRTPTMPGPEPLLGFTTTAVVVHVVWLVALVAALAGRVGPARRAFAVAAAAPALVAVLSALTALPQARVGLLGGLTVFGAVAAVAWPDASRRHRVVVGAAVLAGTAIGAAQILRTVASSSSPAWEFTGYGFYSVFGLASLGGIATTATWAVLGLGLLTVWHRPGILVTAVTVGGTWIVVTHAGIAAPEPGAWMLRPSHLLPFAALLAIPLSLALLTTAVRLHGRTVRA